nr:histidine phosphatase family protein [Gilvimarinus xylanilyticus]
MRHGECEGGRIFRGHTDVALTANGWRQMEFGVGQLKDDWARIISSPLQRCRTFAEHLSQSYGLPLDIAPGLKEIGYGEWEGQCVASVWREQEAACMAWSRDPEYHGPPGGEAFAAFRQRVLDTLKALAENGQPVLLVTHGGVIKLLLSRAHNQPPAWMMQLNVSYGFAASLRYNEGLSSVDYPDASKYVYSG